MCEKQLPGSLSEKHSDNSVESDQLIKEMEWDDLMVDDTVGDMLKASPLPPPPPPPAPALPAELCFSSQPPSVDRDNVQAAAFIVRVTCDRARDR